MTRFLRFAVVGGVGFLADAGALALLLAATPLGPLPARILSIAFAMLVTWLLNRTITFGRGRRSVVAEGARYGGVAVAVAGFNYALYSALVLGLPGFPPIAAVALSSAAAMALSFVGYSRLVFDR